MNTIPLTPGELLYLSAWAEAGNVWGLENPFEELSPEKVSAEVARIQKALLGKGALLPCLDSGAETEEGLRGLLETCGAWEDVWILSTSGMEQRGEKLRYFLHGDSLVRYAFREGEAVLAPASEDDMKAEAAALFGGEDTEEGQETILASAAKLRRIGGLSRARFLQELSALGCGEDFARLIADGVQGKPEICSLMHFRREAGEERLVHRLVTLRLPGEGLIIRPETAEGRESVRFSRLNAALLEKALDEALAAGMGEEAETP